MNSESIFYTQHQYQRETCIQALTVSWSIARRSQVRAEKSWEEVMSVSGNDHSPPTANDIPEILGCDIELDICWLACVLRLLTGIGILTWVVVTKLNTGFGLPVLALSSVLLLLAAPLVFTTLIHLIGLSDPKSAVGLPEGSSRALLALALLGLFAVMASSVLPGPNASGQLPDEFGKQMLTLVGTLMTAVISFYFGSSTTSSPTGSAPTQSPTGSGSAATQPPQ